MNHARNIKVPHDLGLTIVIDRSQRDEDEPLTPREALLEWLQDTIIISASIVSPVLGLVAGWHIPYTESVMVWTFGILCLICFAEAVRHNRHQGRIWAILTYGSLAAFWGGVATALFAKGVVLGVFSF